MAKYNIRAVATKTGLNPATLRTWERRYHAVDPVREANGTRTYSEAAVHRVHLLKRVTDRGHAIRHVAGLDDPALEALLAQAPVLDAQEDALAAICVEQLLNSVDAMDLSCFERLVASSALAFGPSAVVEQVLSPTLKAVGERWHEGRLSIAQEHAISASLSNVLSALIRSYPVPGDAAPIVLATFPGERHELGLLMLRYVLSSLNVPVLYLGIDLPAADIAQTARDHESRVVAISMFHGEGCAQQRAHLHALLTGLDPETEVWLGGAQCASVAKDLDDARVRCLLNIPALEQRVWLTRGNAA